MLAGGRRPLLVAALGALVVAPSCRASQPSALEAASKELADNPSAEVPPPPPQSTRAHPSKRPADARGAPATRPVAGAPATRPTSSPAPASASPAPSTPAAETPAAAQGPGPFETDNVLFDGERILLKVRIEFDDSHRFVADASKGALDDLARLLVERPRIAKVEIQSHRHSRMKTGGRNVTQQRADAVRNYLVQHGVELSRLTAVGYADQVPIDTNRTADGRRANTRVEIHVRELR